MIIRACANLHRHPGSPRGEIHAFQVSVLRTCRELELNFVLMGNIPGIRLVPLRSQKRFGELWRNTCFEVFVAISGQQPYHEFNFAASGEWRAYAFDTYRAPARLQPSVRSPCVVTKTMAECFELNVSFSLADLSRFHSHSVLSLGLSAVLEAQDGSRSFWALRHPGAKPDFHRAEAFALRLDAPGTNGHHAQS